MQLRTVHDEREPPTPVTDLESLLRTCSDAGVTEDPAIASRRQDLTRQLAELTAPRRTAEAALSRAEGLIREIDAIIRERQADALLSLGPTPLNPVHWGPTLSALTQSLRSVANEVQIAWDSDTRRIEFRQDLPRTLFLLLIAGILVIRGRATMEWASGAVLDRTQGRGRDLAAFVISLGQILVPVLGLALLIGAVGSTGLLGLRGQVILETLPVLGVSLFGARWLGLRLFPLRDSPLNPIHVAPNVARQARYLSTGLGLVIGLAFTVLTLAQYEQYDTAEVAVVSFPFLVAAGLMLARLGQILHRAAPVPSDPAEDMPLRARALRVVGRAAMLLGLAGIAMAGIGYLNAGAQLIYPTAMSLALMGLLLVINSLIHMLYALIARISPEEAREALIPILTSFALVLAALPLFALLWGARQADLIELWTRVLEGFSIGETRISPSNFLVFALVFAIGYVFTRMVQGALKGSILPKTTLDPGGRTAVVSGVGYVGLFLAALIAISSAGIDLSSLAIVAGALSVGIGFGLQTIVQNFVSGIILLIERPIAEGDWIEVGPHMGIVKSISVRATRIETFDKTEVIVPNGDFISGSVTNWTRGNKLGRVMLTVGVAYGTDTRRVEAILKDIAHNHPLVALTPAPGIDFMGFGADSLDFRVRVVLSDVNFLLSVQTELYHQIAERFVAEGIEIPFAQRDVWLRNPETLVGGGGQDAPVAAAQPMVPVPPAPLRAEKFDTDDLDPDADPEGAPEDAPDAPMPPR